MNKKPHIKILILNWNGESIIERCLDSVVEMNYDNFSIDIIDNGSEDNSIGIITQKYPNIKIHQISSNLGYSKGYNYAFDQLKDSHFKYYLLLNNDTSISSDLLTNLYKNTLQYGERNIYGPKINFINTKKIWFSGGYYNIYSGFCRHIGINTVEKNIMYKTKITKYISGCCMLINKTLISDLNGFDEDYSMYYEDVDLCHRASLLHATSCYVIENSTIFHDVSYSLGQKSFKKIYYKIISQFKFIYKSNNFIIFLISILIHVMLIPIYLIFIIFKLIF